MTRGRLSFLPRIAPLALALALPAAAMAADATVSKVEGEVKVGREGAWKTAAAGAVIAAADFLSLGPAARATVKLGDGTVAEFVGKVIVPGRRLSSEKAAGALLKLTRAVQKASEAVVGVDAKGTVPGAGKASDKLGQKKRAIFVDTDEKPKSSEADFAEAALGRGDYFDARNRAQAIVDDPNDSPAEKRRARYVLGRVHAAEGEFGKALSAFDGAAAARDPAEGDAADHYRGAALVERGLVHVQLGLDGKADADFKAAIEASPKTAQAAKANLYLGALALEAQKPAVAEAHFKLLAGYPDLEAAARDLTAGAGAN